MDGYDLSRFLDGLAGGIDFFESHLSQLGIGNHRIDDGPGHPLGVRFRLGKHTWTAEFYSANGKFKQLVWT